MTLFNFPAKFGVVPIGINLGRIRMIIFDNEKFIKAVESHPESKKKIAVKADSSDWVIDKILQGKTDLNLASLEKLGNYVGLDVQVTFIEKKYAEHTDN